MLWITPLLDDLLCVLSAYLAAMALADAYECESLCDVMCVLWYTVTAVSSWGPKFISTPYLIDNKHSSRVRFIGLSLSLLRGKNNFDETYYIMV